MQIINFSFLSFAKVILNEEANFEHINFYFFIKLFHILETLLEFSKS